MTTLVRRSRAVRVGIAFGMGLGLMVLALALWGRPGADPSTGVQASGGTASAGATSTSSPAPKIGPAPEGFVPVTDDRPGKPAGNVVGYAKRSAVIPDGTNVEDDGGIIDVWDASGSVLLGHLWPNGYGYRSLEEEAAEGISRDNPPSLPPVSVPKTVESGS